MHIMEAGQLVQRNLSLVGEAIPEQGLSTSDGLGFSQVSEDEFEEADPLGN